MRRSLRGFVLATVFFLMVVLIFLAASLFRLIPVELNWALQQRIDTEAYYAATGGIKHSLGWLGAVQAGKIGDGYNPPHEPFGVQGSQEAYFRTTITDPAAYPYKLKPKDPPANPTSDDTYFPANLPALQLRSERLQFADDWTAQVTIFPDRWTPPHPFLASSGNSGRPPCYVIVSCAFQDSNHNGVCDQALGERFKLRAEASVVAGTFARYAYFVDEWPDQGPATLRFNLQSNNQKPVFDGPVHTNGIPILLPNGAASFWNQVATSQAVPHFSAELSFAGAVGATYTVPSISPNYDGVGYLLGNYQGSSPARRPFQETSPSNFQPVPGRYERIFKAGQDALRPRDRIDLPADSDRVALAAWGHRAGDPLPNLGGVGNNELFIRTQTNVPQGGAIVTGNVSSCLLDVLNTDGYSVVNNAFNSPTPSAGAGAVKLVHNTQITYIAGTENVPVYSTSTTPATGTFFVTNTFATDPGGSNVIPTTTQVVVGTTATEVVQVQFGPGTVVIYDAPGGGPAGGGPSIPSVPTGTVTQTVNVPLLSESTLFLQVDGPYTGTYLQEQQIQVSTSERIVYDSYSPTDMILEAYESQTDFNSTYLLATATSAVPLDRLPVILPTEPAAATGFLSYPVSASQAGVLRQSRTDPRVYYYQKLDRHLNGAYWVNGELNGLQGWNRGPKTIQAETRTFSSGGSTATAFDVGIVGPIRQFGLAQTAIPTSGNNSLGLIARSILVRVPPDRIHPTLPDRFRFDANPAAAQPLYIFASLLALGGDFRTDLALYPNGRFAQLNVVGGVVQKTPGELYNTANSKGWFSNYNFDQYLSVGPPPAFPLDGTFQLFFFRVDTL